MLHISPPRKLAASSRRQLESSVNYYHRIDRIG
jgi:hypothetical protein